jgi:hypothetical protein
MNQMAPLLRQPEQQHVRLWTACRIALTAILSIIVQGSPVRVGTQWPAEKRELG